MTYLRRSLIAPALLALASSAFASEPAVAETTATLTQQLQSLADASKSKTPAEKRAIMDGAIDKLRASNILEKAAKKGDTMPAFSLPDVSRGTVASSNLLKRGPLVVVFYRGDWCPYCNLQLLDLQKHLGELEGLGARLVAISPQTPDNSVTTAQKRGLTYYVVSDANSRVAAKFGLMFRLPPELKKLYADFGLNLEKSNGAREWSLPVAATYVVSREGEIVYSFLDVDYKKRAETADVIDALKRLPR